MTNPCPHSAAAEALFTARARLGLAKYGTTLADAGLSLDRLLLHIQEELADALVYTVAAREVGAWQPIETAPRDGTHILCFHPKYDMILNGVWDGGHINAFEMKDERLEYVKDFYPTHWMPLPAPPVLEDKP